MFKKIILCICTVSLIFNMFIMTSFAYDYKKGQVLTQDLNIRKSNEATSNSLGTISKGEIVEVKSYYDGWYYISYDDISGWVNCWFIYVEDEPIINGSINGETVNLREDSDISSEIVSTLDDNTYINIYGRDDNWYYIEAKEKKGWVYEDFVYKYIYPIGSGIVLGDDVNVRSNSNLNASIIKQVDKGTHFSIYGEFDSWYKVSVNDGEYGWIYGDLLDVKYNKTTSRGAGALLNAVEPPKSKNVLTIVQQQLVETAKKYLGVRYVWGGESPSGFDCSGLIKYLYNKVGVKLLHRADLQANYGTSVSYNALKPGDVIFFDTNGGKNYINHVGMYIGNGQFIHASSSSSNGHAVAISNLEGFYSRCYMCARRYLDY